MRECTDPCARAPSGSDPVTVECCRVSLPSASLSALCSFTQKKTNSFKHTLFPSQLTSPPKLCCYHQIPAQAEQIASIRPISVHCTTQTRSEREEVRSSIVTRTRNWRKVGKKKMQAEPPTTPAFGCTSATLKDLTRAQKCHINTFRGAAVSGARR